MPCARTLLSPIAPLVVALMVALVGCEGSYFGRLVSYTGQSCEETPYGVVCGCSAIVAGDPLGYEVELDCTETPDGYACECTIDGQTYRTFDLPDDPCESGDGPQAFIENCGN